MKILITGGAGFIGSSLVRFCVRKGHDVVNLDALTYAGRPENLAEVISNPLYFFEKGDIRDKIRIREVFEKHLPDVVVHLAAESHVDRSIDSPGCFVETNVVGTFNLLQEAMRFWDKQGRPDNFKFHHVSTDEVFGSLSLGGLDKFSEVTPYNPRSPYSATKASSDQLVRAWNHTFGLPTVITNCSNNFGPYQFPEKLIPLMIINSILERPLPIYGDGLNVRDWLYVDDHALSLYLAVQKGRSGETYMVGGNNERSNLEIVKTICGIMDVVRPRKRGSHQDLITFVKDRPGHDERYAVDGTKIKNELGWQPSVSIEAGLAQTVKWYLNNAHWWSPLLDGAGLTKEP